MKFDLFANGENQIHIFRITPQICMQYIIAGAGILNENIVFLECFSHQSEYLNDC